MGKLNINRGTSYIIHYVHMHDGVIEPLTGATVYFTVKTAEFSTDATDADAIIAKTLVEANGDIPDAATGAADIEILPADTDDTTPGKLFYDIRVKESDGRVYKMDEGTIKLDGSPTNRASV